MKRGVVIAILCVMVLAIILPQIALAQTWYVGNWKPNINGIKATILTPASAPYLGSLNGESSWVSTSPIADQWAQAGWLYWKGEAGARPYVEHKVNGAYGLEEYGTQSWGTSKEYKLIGWGTSWATYIDSSWKGSYGPLSNPQWVEAMAEVHDNSTTVLNTLFGGVSYYASDTGTWHYFDEDYFHADLPYHYTKYANYSWYAYGP
jgi:hypothetical protein